MKSLLLIAFTILLLVIVSACSANENTSIATTLSDQPDMATYQKYFSDLGIGKMPPEPTNPPEELQMDFNIFTTDDYICLYGSIIMECQLRSAIYDVNAAKVVRESGLPKPMMGGFANFEPINLAVGEYEYKVYVDNILVGVFPFYVVSS